MPFRYILAATVCLALVSIHGCGDNHEETQPTQTPAVATAGQATTTPGDADDGGAVTPGTPDSSVDAKAPGRSKIAFVSGRDGNKELYVMGVDGSDLRRLTDTPADEEFPVWSPDGHQIAFVSSLDSRTGEPPIEYFVVNVDGSGLAKLAETEILSVPPAIEWSPDGSRIALSLRIDGRWDIHVVNADGTGLANVTSDPNDESQPLWSPNGSQIIYERHGEATSLHTMNADGTEQARLTENGWSASWSPDGVQIAFISNRDGNTEVYVMNADGTGVVNVSQHPGLDGPFGGIAWSPDSSRLAFGSHRDGAADVFVASADGSSQMALTTRLGPGESRIDQITWSPDGSKLAFAASIGHSMVPYEIFVVNADGSGLTNLTNTGTLGEGIVGWSGDGERIFYVGEVQPAEPTIEFDHDIFVINVDGTGLATLADSPENEGMAVLWP